MRSVIPGLGFAMLWATASVATKFGLLSADPLILALIRFMITGILLGIFCYLLRYGKYRFPEGKEWKQLTILGFLNTTFYLGAYVIALQYIPAGLTGLFIATNPLMISLLSVILLKRRLGKLEITGMLIALCGLMVTTFPVLQAGEAEAVGIFLIMISMFAYSLGGVYYSKTNIALPGIVVNLFQVFIGGLLLIPLTFATGSFHIYHNDLNLWGGLLWLILPVSVFANRLWFYLLKIDPVRAGTWLFLTPVFGYLWAYLFLGERITVFSVAGTIIVIAGLYLTRIEKR